MSCLLFGCRVYKEFTDSYVQDKEQRLAIGQEEEEFWNGGGRMVKTLPDIDGLLTVRYSLDTNEVWARGTTELPSETLIQEFKQSGWQESASMAPYLLPLSPNHFRAAPDISWWPGSGLSSATGTFLEGPAGTAVRAWIPHGETCFYLWDLG